MADVVGQTGGFDYIRFDYGKIWSGLDSGQEQEFFGQSTADLRDL